MVALFEKVVLKVADTTTKPRVIATTVAVQTNRNHSLVR